MIPKLSDCHREFGMFSAYNDMRFLFEGKKDFGEVLQSGYRSEALLSLYDCFSVLFLEWPLRNNYVRCDDMMKDLGVNAEALDDRLNKRLLLIYVQFVLNAAWFVERSISSEKSRFFACSDSVIFCAIVNLSFFIVRNLNASINFKRNEVIIESR